MMAVAQQVLVDTSVWVAHFRQRNAVLVRLLEADAVLMHPMVLAELRCGTPPAPREDTLKFLSLLAPSRSATLEETAQLVEAEQIYGLGCGVVDMMLLASTLITPATQLWTLDKRLAELAQRFNVAFNELSD
jgi:predicted nucleic acid-binding protein